MSTPRHLSRDPDILVLCGTTKGAFLVGSDASRERWEVAGPYFPGQAVYAMALEPRRRRLLAATHSAHWGAVVSLSDDLGRTFTNPERAPIRFPEGSGASLAQIWQLVVDAEVIHAGVEPAALFTSRDGGETWSLNQALWDHPQRPQWQPGGGGLCLHTIVPRGDRLLVAISTAGVYRSDDGGATWRQLENGLPIDDPYMIAGLAIDPHDPDYLVVGYQDGRLFASDDAGERWLPLDAQLEQSPLMGLVLR
jgi:BNR/Asp-box repeat